MISNKSAFKNKIFSIYFTLRNYYSSREIRSLVWKLIKGQFKSVRTNFLKGA